MRISNDPTYKPSAPRPAPTLARRETPLERFYRHAPILRCTMKQLKNAKIISRNGEKV